MKKNKTLPLAICCLVGALWSEAQCMSSSDDDSDDISYSINTNYVYKKVKDTFFRSIGNKIKINEQIFHFENLLDTAKSRKVLKNIVELTKNFAGSARSDKKLFEGMGLIIYEKVKNESSDDKVISLLNDLNNDVFHIDEMYPDLFD
ncbi:MAG: hypothetical protein K2X28_04720 [Alphaproteobacteria bacterium]|nr:hypothetical protein [Alphaproteobacteria bacterium]